MRRSRWSVLTSLAALGAAAAGAACTRGESRPVDSAGAGARPARETVALTPGVPDPGVHATRPAYRGAPVAGGGSVTGTVTLDGPAPAADAADGTFATADSAERADPTLARTCVRAGGRRGAGGGPASAPALAAGGAVEGAVVWLEGVAAGKPMPADRRYELALADCRLAPQALGAAAGGTLNVHGVDALPSRLVFARAGAGADAGRVLLRTAMSAPGQVVPDERVLAEPGLVEARGEQPSWLRAWVVAFDHPYFTAAGAGGAFTFADVPPGRYTLVAWHPRLGRAEQAVAVAPGQAQTVAVRLAAAKR